MSVASPHPVNHIAAIEKAVQALAPGEVASYGEIARRAGLPRRARLVGKVLRESVQELPWHRVVRADGRIAFAEGSREFRIQVQRLAEEGIETRNGRVRMLKRIADRHGSERQSLDEILWSGE